MIFVFDAFICVFYNKICKIKNQQKKCEDNICVQYFQLQWSNALQIKLLHCTQKLHIDIIASKI